MIELLRGIDTRALLLILALGGGSNVVTNVATNAAQFLGVTAPARAEATVSIDQTAEAQGRALEAQERVSKLQKLLADCQERCGDD